MLVVQKRVWIVIRDQAPGNLLGAVRIEFFERNGFSLLLRKFHLSCDQWSYNSGILVYGLELLRLLIVDHYLSVSEIVLLVLLLY